MCLFWKVSNHTRALEPVIRFDGVFVVIYMVGALARAQPSVRGDKI
jgi:hypothetical protein